MPLESLARLILLPDLELKKQFSLGRWGVGFIVKKPTPFEVCPKCANKCYTIYDHRQTKAWDQPIRGKAVQLIIDKRRFFCKTCQKPFMEHIPGIGKFKRTTERFRSGLCWASENFSDLQKVEKYFRCSSDLVYRATYEQLELRQRSRTYPLPEAIGIDEHSLRKPRYKATEYSTIVVDHKNKKVFDLIEGRNKEDLIAAFQKIHGTENVKKVTLDLSNTFRSFCRETFINAILIADRFHVQRLFNKKVNKYRMKVTGDDRKNPIRKLLLRNNDDIEPHERRAVRQWLNQYPDAREVYDYKEAMRRIFKMKGRNRAARALTKLTDRMAKSKLEDIRNLRKVIVSWRNEILNYHEGRLSNGRTEGFNRKAKLCQRRAFGYKSHSNYRLRLLNLCR